MNDAHDRGSELVERALARLVDEEVSRARTDLTSAPLEPESRGRLGALGGVAAALMIGLLVLVAPRLADFATAPGTGATDRPSASSPGANASGLPTLIQGQRVLTPDEAQALIGQSTGEVQVLVGGWLHEAAPMSCPVAGGQWNPCRALPLYRSRSGGPAMFIFGIDRVGRVDLPPKGFAKGIVLSVHTHDAACGEQVCANSPVADAIVWVGDVESASYVEAAEPTAGVDVADAVAAARTLLPSTEAWNLVATNAGAFGNLVPQGGDIEGDRWVWAVAFESTSTGGTRTAVVYVDYANGMPLEADVVGPPSSTDGS